MPGAELVGTGVVGAAFVETDVLGSVLSVPDEGTPLGVGDAPDDFTELVLGVHAAAAAATVARPANHSISRRAGRSGTV